MAQLMVQQLDANNDPIEGPTGPVFLTDLDACAQILGQRLRFLQGEWWEDLSLGYPLFQKVINASAAPADQEAAALVTQAQITSFTPWVIQILSFTFQTNTSGRGSTFTAVVLTVFGTLTVTNAPGSSASVSPS
jgi:hypothetical protein